MRHGRKQRGIVRLLWADSRNYRYFLRCSSVVERCEGVDRATASALGQSSRIHGPGAGRFIFNATPAMAVVGGIGIAML